MKLPTVLNIEGPVVVFGGGNVGLRKVKYLLEFTSDIILVAEDAKSVPENIKFVKTKLITEDINNHIPENASLVVAALSDVNLNHNIAKLCREKGILVNVVDDPDPSTILFPALSSKGDLNIAISTSGKCPFLAKRIRTEVDDWIQVKAGWLEVLAPLRETLIQNPEKNNILMSIYQNSEIGNLIDKGEIDQARKMAMEVLRVYRQS
jgi:precorrin-2 dehydrogenase/sirohydrochlorin ferrochelatase